MLDINFIKKSKDWPIIWKKRKIFYNRNDLIDFECKILESINDLNQTQYIMMHIPPYNVNYKKFMLISLLGVNIVEFKVIIDVYPDNSIMQTPYFS